MNWTLGVPLLLMAVISGFLVWYLRPRKKKEEITEAAEPDFSSRHSRERGVTGPEVRDPLDDSPLSPIREKTVDISVLTPFGKTILVRVNLYNSDIVKRCGLGAFPNFRHNLEQYGRRHRNYYRRYFQPEYYYVLGGDFDFDPIMWWIYFDLFFGHDFDSPAYAYDSQVWPEMQEEYQERRESLPEQDDPAGLGTYLMSGATREEPVSFHQEFPGDREVAHEPETPERIREDDPAGLRDYLSREAGPAPQTESPQKEAVRFQGEDPVGLESYLSRGAAEVETRETPEIMSVEHGEPAAASEVHETETAVTETVEVDTSPSE
jgi:hypothetical protein